MYIYLLYIMASLIVIAKQIHANMVLRHAVATIKADYVTVVISRFFLLVTVADLDM